MNQDLQSYRDSRVAGAEAGEPGAVPLSRVLTGLFRERRLVIACALFTAAAAAVWSTMRDMTYVSTGSFLLESGGEEIHVRALANADDEDRAFRGVDGNVAHVLYSSELLRRVGARLGDDSSAAIADLRDRLLIDTPKHSSLVQVSVIDVSPEAARETLRIYMEEAIQHHLAVYSDERDIALVEREHAAAVAAVEAANDRLAAFVRETGTSQFGAELEARRADLAEALRARQTLVEDTEFETSDEPRLAGLREQLRDLESRLLDLRTRLRPSDQAIVNTHRKIEELRKRAVEIAAEHRAFMREHVKKRIDETSAAVDELEPFEPRFVALGTDVEKARERLTFAETALARAQRKRLLASHQVSALQILDHPDLPTMSEDVSQTAFTLRALFAGLFLGLVLAMVRTLTDQRVRDADDLEEVGAPVLATIPHLSPKHIKRHHTARIIG